MQFGVKVTKSSWFSALWRNNLWHNPLRRNGQWQIGLILLILPLILTINGCSLPQVKAEDRIFLNLSLDFLGEYRLPKMEFAGTPVGGLSGITYDRQRDRFYAISDDRSNLAPARFYTLKLVVGNSDSSTDGSDDPIGIQNVEIEKVTTLYDQNGEPFAAGTIDLEGIALSPRQSVFIASEGAVKDGAAPFINEFDLETGQWRSQLPIPTRFLPAEVDGRAIGLQDNLGFESLTLNDNGAAGGLEPFRVFTATEAPLQQDLALSESSDPTQPAPVRMMHYLAGDNQATLLSEHLYLVEPPPQGAENGLTDLITLDQGGHFLGLERSFGPLVGVNAQIFQLAVGGATDTSGIPGFGGDVSGITPIFKRLTLNLSDLDIGLDNLEGMALGPQLPDGTQSLVVVSDDNFSDLQVTQFLLFRLHR